MQLQRCPSPLTTDRHLIPSNIAGGHLSVCSKPSFDTYSVHIPCFILSLGASQKSEYPRTIELCNGGVAALRKLTNYVCGKVEVAAETNCYVYDGQVEEKQGCSNEKDVSGGRG